MQTKQNKQLIIAIGCVMTILGMFIILCTGFGAGNKVTSNNGSHILGEKNDFDESNLVSVSDKENIYYDKGIFYIVRDGFIKIIQSYSIVPREQSLLEYIKGFDGFNQNDATFICYDNEGMEQNCDLSVIWSKASFGELMVYWKTDDGGGMMLCIIPESVTTVLDFQYYSDLLEYVGE